MIEWLYLPVAALVAVLVWTVVDTVAERVKIV